ncbi:DUF349 domain-containing protein [Thalassomonas viridans]|uniref:DUF349 domain-containing protein n=1 Tax=Thalassomonas viridans TaxID=137584 RepID=A0AAF0C764_9GAMM|nr:DUF349 domain-containing protein [Thalassomonas viridans]WDE02835.1 DUF349 domain-containing protein [Thalassomonas viridans]
MIFSKLFKANKARWQHKDSTIRITAISEDLTAENSQDREVLLQLLNEDDNELVRRAALIKLADFELWLKTSQNNSNGKVKEFARQQISLMLQDQHELKLTSETKVAFLKEQATVAMLEPWLHKESDAGLIIELYKKINKPQLMQQLFVQKQDPQVQLFFVEQTGEVTVLEKFLKKAVNDEVSQLITDKINQITELAQKPGKVKKQVQLLLSKLLALKDVTDYEQVLSKREQLQTEWQAAQEDLLCLTDEEQAGFTEKYQSIGKQLVKLFAPKEEAYQQSLIEKELQKNKQIAKDSFDRELNDLSQALTTAVFENTTLDENAFGNKLAALSEKIAASILNEQEIAAYQQTIRQQQAKLSKLPVIAQSVSDATHLISRISQLALPQTIEELNERQPIFDAWLQEWKTTEKQADGVLPESIKAAYQELSQHWRTGLKPLQQEQQGLFRQVQKKMPELKRLLASGKYKASFGVFKRIKGNFERLSASQQHRLQRDFDQVSEKIAELSDWEHYIATPRKQQLLDEVKQLIEQPIDNPNELAAKIKQYRKVWNSLGHADEDVDKTLNHDFNQAVEQAFAPCRLYFAEQESLREQNLAKRLEIIEQAKALSAELEKTPVDFKHLDAGLNKLNHQWQGTGEVDRAKYKGLLHDYNQALQPLKSAIRDFHQDNIAQKNVLIEKARAQLTATEEGADITDAIEQVKAIQAKWRNVGYAGPREENKLWQRFRAVNDELFKKRDLLKNEQQQAQSAQQAEFESQLQGLATQFGQARELAEFSAIRQQTQELLEQVIATKPVIKAVANAIEAQIKGIDEAIEKHKSEKEKQIWLTLFNALTEIASDKITSADELSGLSAFWQKKVQEVLAATEVVDRKEKTLELEILAGVESPAELAQDRMQAQVRLMQEQMSSGGSVDLQQSFINWLQLGRLTSQDLALLDRLKGIYCQ